MPTGFRTRRPLRRRNDAGRRVSYVPAAGMRPPARKRRRKGTLVRDRCGNCPSGEKTAPGDRLPTGLRTRRPLRRRNDAGRRVPYVSAAGTGPPASIQGKSEDAGGPGYDITYCATKNLGRFISAVLPSITDDCARWTTMRSISKTRIDDFSVAALSASSAPS